LTRWEVPRYIDFMSQSSNNPSGKPPEISVDGGVDGAVAESMEQMQSARDGLKSEMPNFDRLRGLLDEKYDWPAEYTFKFISLAGQAQEVARFFLRDSVKVRHSENGRYVAMTIKRKVESADEIVSVYQEVGQIKGVISI